MIKEEFESYMNEDEVDVDVDTDAGDVDAMDAEGELRLSTSSTKKTHTISVTDNGSGMDEATQKKIFDPFFTTKPVGVGTGLGLSICHGIAVSMGGRIEVDSIVGQGTTFRLHFPVPSRERFEALELAKYGFRVFSLWPASYLTTSVTITFGTVG